MTDQHEAPTIDYLALDREAFFDAMRAMTTIEIARTALKQVTSHELPETDDRAIRRATIAHRYNMLQFNQIKKI